ncbi:unnamed protein product, partial [marine sediment metagenome]
MNKKTIVRIRDKHEITLPKKIREQLNWTKNDYLMVIIQNKEKDTAILKKVKL